jgi:hypothetical protein
MTCRLARESTVSMSEAEIAQIVFGSSGNNTIDASEPLWDRNDIAYLPPAGHAQLDGLLAHAWKGIAVGNRGSMRLAIVCSLLFVLLFLITCGARAVGPANPGDPVPPLDGPVTSQCCIGDIAADNHVQLPQIDINIAPQCVLGEAITHVQIQGTLALCAGEEIEADFVALRITFTGDRTQCGGTGPSQPQTCNFRRLSYRAHARFTPPASCVSASEIRWLGSDVFGSDSTIQAFCQSSLHDTLLQSFDAQFITAAWSGATMTAGPTGRPATCPLSSFVSVNRPRCDDWQQRWP